MNKMSEELIKVQKERDLAHAKLEVLEKKEKQERYDKNLIIFENGGDLVLDIKDDEEKEVDECILNVKCQGDCDPVVNQAEQLRNMKLQGGHRNSPQESSGNRNVQQCPQCGLGFQKNVSLQKHMNDKHGNNPNCTICHVGFWNKDVLTKHVNQVHRVSPAIQKTAVQSSKRPCAFFLQPRGCKKGSECDFSHSTVKNTVEKVPKVCRNSLNCTWKPSCRYVHPEDGETVPQRAPRERNNRVQDFGSPNLSRPPPGHRPVRLGQQAEVQVQESSNRVTIKVPSYSLQEFPNMPAPQRVTKIWIN